MFSIIYVYKEKKKQNCLPSNNNNEKVHPSCKLICFSKNTFFANSKPHTVTLTQTVQIS